MIQTIFRHLRRFRPITRTNAKVVAYGMFSAFAACMWLWYPVMTVKG